jgi:hypothetical protein
MSPWRQRCYKEKNVVNVRKLGCTVLKKTDLVWKLFQGHKGAHVQLKLGLLYGDDVDARFVGDAFQLAGVAAHTSKKT